MVAIEQKLKSRKLWVNEVLNWNEDLKVSLDEQAVSFDKDFLSVGYLRFPNKHFLEQVPKLFLPGP